MEFPGRQRDQLTASCRQWHAGYSDGSLYAFNITKNGKQKWHYTTGAAIAGSLQTFNGVIYASSQDDAVYALDAQSGALLWHIQTGGPLSSAPVLADGVRYAGSTDAHVYALWANDGSQIWSFSVDDQTAAGTLRHPHRKGHLLRCRQLEQVCDV